MKRDIQIILNRMKGKINKPISLGLETSIIPGCEVEIIGSFNNDNGTLYRCKFQNGIIRNIKESDLDITDYRRPVDFDDIRIKAAISAMNAYIQSDKKLSKEEIAEESVLIADKLVTNIIINTQGEENNNYIRMIYTGFNNYQGFKIHEGDILLCKDFDLGSIGIDWNFFLKKIYVKEAVFLYKGKFCIKINESAITLEHILYSIGEIRFDIIGNRYDNPELLDIQE